MRSDPSGAGVPGATMPVLEDETDGTPTRAGPARVPLSQRESPFATAVAVACIYEVLAEAVNVSVARDVLPSFSALARRLTLARVRALATPPPWMRLTAGLSAGLVVHVMRPSTTRSRRAWWARRRP
jgi:hypothetical protein